MRRTFFLVVVASLFVGLVVGPAWADRPAEVTAAVTFGDINPCTSDDHQVTLSWNIRVHHHANNEVATFKTTVTTSDGGFGRGVETQVVNGTTASNALNIRVSYANGQWFTVKGHRKVDLDTGEVTMNTFRARCGRA